METIIQKLENNSITVSFKDKYNFGNEWLPGRVKYYKKIYHNKTSELLKIVVQMSLLVQRCKVKLILENRKLLQILLVAWNMLISEDILNYDAI